MKKNDAQRLIILKGIVLTSIVFMVNCEARKFNPSNAVVKIHEEEEVSKYGGNLRQYYRFRFSRTMLKSKNSDENTNFEVKETIRKRRRRRRSWTDTNQSDTENHDGRFDKKPKKGLVAVGCNTCLNYQFPVGRDIKVELNNNTNAYHGSGSGFKLENPLSFLSPKSKNSTGDNSPSSNFYGNNFSRRYKSPKKTPKTEMGEETHPANDDGGEGGESMVKKEKGNFEKILDENQQNLSFKKLTVGDTAKDVKFKLGGINS